MRRFLRLAPAVLVLTSLLALLVSRGETVPLFAARTGLMCQNCHFDPNGGGPRNDFGFAYARNRHSLEPETGTPWGELTLTNKIGENMPVYIGVNHRFMLLTNNSDRLGLAPSDPPNEEGINRFGFFNMENAIHLAFQPHARLSLVYTTDAFSSNAVRQKEAFGLIGGFPLNGYVKAGRFRVPFGLRMDDHTVATRNSFLEFSTGPTSPKAFLPYDPRFPDQGIELGVENSGIFGRFAFTNGHADVLQGQFAETKTLKLGYNTSSYQAGLSIYDNYNKGPTSLGLKRATRWGYYGLAHYGQLALAGEVAAGTDENEPEIPDVATGLKTNRFAWYGELDYTPVRWLNARVRYDYLVYDRSSDKALREANTHTRYAFEAEYVPVPFAELRAVVRRIDHKDEAAYGFQDETQGYLQFHFSY